MSAKTCTASTPASTQETLTNAKFITVTAVFIALTYVFTAFVNIRLPIAAAGGLIHLGNVQIGAAAVIVLAAVEQLRAAANKTILS